MSIEDFIEERETPYSKITDIKISEDGEIVFFTERYDLKHPLCPILLTLNRSLPKDHFKILYGNVEVKE